MDNEWVENKKNLFVHDQHLDRWKVTVVDTGLDTMTGGRISVFRNTSGTSHS